MNGERRKNYVRLKCMARRKLKLSRKSWKKEKEKAKYQHQQYKQFSD